MQQNDRGMTPKPTIGRVCFISWWSIFECGFTGVILIGVKKEREKTIQNPQLDTVFSYGDYRSPTGNIYFKLSNISYSWQYFGITR